VLGCPQSRFPQRSTLKIHFPFPIILWVVGCVWGVCGGGGACAEMALWHSDTGASAPPRLRAAEVQEEAVGVVTMLPESVKVRGHLQRTPPTQQQWKPWGDEGWTGMHLGAVAGRCAWQTHVEL
jgi:hypothetical protein